MCATCAKALARAVSIVSQHANTFRWRGLGMCHPAATSHHKIPSLWETHLSVAFGFGPRILILAHP